MPGLIVTVAVAVGQRVATGTTLIAIEAMKMETHIAADRDCEVVAIHVQSGDRVAAKDSLLELKSISQETSATGFASRQCSTPVRIR
jgi:pyruvate carboxylase